MNDLFFDAPDTDIYREEEYIPFRDCDCLGRVSLYTWISWLAELAGDQYRMKGMGREELLRQNQVFLLYRISLRVLRHPKCYETLKGATWEKGVETICFRRNFDFTDDSGTVCAEASSLWILCDPEKHRILRPSALGRPVPDVDRPISCPFPVKIDLPENAQPLGERRVFFSDLDANGHIFCANYGRIFMDWLPEAYQKRPYRDFSLNYIKEAKPGETILLSGAGEPDRYVMAGCHGDGTLCFSAEMTF